MHIPRLFVGLVTGSTSRQIHKLPWLPYRVCRDGLRVRARPGRSAREPRRRLATTSRLHGIDYPGGDEASFPFGYVPTTPPPLSPSPRHDDQLAKEEVGDESRGGARKVGGSERREQQGVFLTWEDLWVSAPDRKGRRVSILSAITGYARPGEVLSIMGPSGSGKSTLLDALAGRLGSGVTQKGDILINGQRQKLAFGSSAYVTQDDVLMTTLTVREAVYYSAQLQLPDSMSRSEKRERAEATIREMGLEGAMDTRIGGWAYKGISGGQKRRVSICIELLTRPQLLFLDEPTSGLDSAASYHVMDRITRLARREGMTVVAAIHQPSSEVFQLFHGLCLLAYGRTVFFRAASMANEFFASNGFPCPPLRNPSDHYLRTINKDFDKVSVIFFHSDEARTSYIYTLQLRPGHRQDIEEDYQSNPRSTAEAIEILVKSYRSTVSSQQVTAQIEEMRGMLLDELGAGDNLADPPSRPPRRSTSRSAPDPEVSYIQK
ncbi:ABC-2 type transporter [Musa troglodytarum]|uniref:ABC-2 type transporter n=1 Tax=Musa troglodytarum TaxID=320322 RepID=A0A9E7FYT5_9LILI|nr:ABC-2 type transporter [Musa troglodytarum]